VERFIKWVVFLFPPETAGLKQARLGGGKAPGFISAPIKNIVSDNQPPDTSVKSLSSILQFFNQKSKIKNQKSKIKNQKSKIKNRKSKIENRKSIDLFPLPLDRRHLGYKCANVLPIF
jgi:hypothetical protein